MREAVLNSIVDYLQVHQKEKKKKDIIMASSQHLSNTSLVTAFLQKPCLPWRLSFLLCFGIYL